MDDTKIDIFEAASDSLATVFLLVIKASQISSAYLIRSMLNTKSSLANSFIITCASIIMRENFK